MLAVKASATSPRQRSHDVLMSHLSYQEVEGSCGDVTAANKTAKADKV